MDLKAKIDELARKLTPIPDMAVLLDMEESKLRMLLINNADLRRTYNRAKAEMALEIREREIEMARAGSPTASANLGSYLAQMEE